MINTDELTYLPKAKFLRERPILLISDCPLDLELKQKSAFSSQSAATQFAELNKVGATRLNIHAAYLFNFRPEKGDLSALFHSTGLPPSEYTYWPQSKKDSILNFAYNDLLNLREDIKQINPSLIICTGRWALYFLTGETSVAETKKSPFGTILKWRASHLKLGSFWQYDKPHVVIPILPASAAYQLPEYAMVIKQDYIRTGILAKAAIANNIYEYTEEAQNYQFVIAPKFAEVKQWLLTEILALAKGPKHYAVDVETRNGYHDCIGIAKSRNEAICIPWATTSSPSYWTEGEELELISLLREFLLHPNCKQIGQNYWYDMQYMWRDLLVKTKPAKDSMVQQHTLFAGMEKNLAFLVSMYAKYYRYWKEEGATHKGASDRDRWQYNCKDCCWTYEVAHVLDTFLEASPANIQAAYSFQLNKALPTLVNIMNRGVAANKTEKDRLYVELTGIMAVIREELDYIIGEPFNPLSPDQKKALFYDLFELPVQLDPKTKKPTLAGAALETLAERYPLIRPVADRVSEFGNLKTFSSTFLKAGLDIDGRMRTSYNLCGTDTYRLSSSENAFGSGMNLQNVSKGGKTVTGKQLPNCRSLFIPDPGFTFFDIDLDSADLRIVVAESGASGLQEMLDAGLKPYVELMKEYYNDPGKNKYSDEYRIFKGFAHGCITGDHEILTPEGWLAIEDYIDGISIAVWDKQTQQIHFEIPEGINRDFVTAEEPLVEFSGSAFSQLTTLDHKFPYTVDSSEKLSVKMAKDLPNSARIPYTGFYTGGSTEVDSAYIQLIAALQADGTIGYTTQKNETTVRWHFKKQRKIIRLETLLNAVNFQYTKMLAADGSTFFTVKGYFEPFMKTAGSWLLQFSQNNLKTWVEEHLHWDGFVTESYQHSRAEITSTSEEFAEWYQTICHLTGHGSKISVMQRDRTRKPLYTVSKNNRKFFNLSAGSKRYITHEGTKVYCPKTSTGFFLVRRNGHISVTGNTHYLGSASGLAARLGLLVHEVDQLQKWYFQRNPEIPKWHAELKKQVFKRGWIENVFGYRKYFWNKSEPTIMQIAAAWKPQSSVGLLINHGMVNIEENEPDIQVLLQVHDSLAGQFPTAMPHLADAVKRRCEIELPYDKPIIIPVDIKTSTISWGDC